MKRPTAQGIKRTAVPPPYPSYEHIRKTDDMEEIVSRLVGYGRPRVAAERAVVVAHTLRGGRPPMLNQIPELDALARMLGRGKR